MATVLILACLPALGPAEIDAERADLVMIGLSSSSNTVQVEITRDLVALRSILSSSPHVVTSSESGEK